MAQGREDLVSIRVLEKLQVLSPEYSACSYFRVPSQQRKENNEAYEPQALAIGPYFRGDNRFKAMERQKIHYLRTLLQRRNETNVKKYVLALRALEERACNCYLESARLNPDDFVEMMLLDGCFIVELIRKYTMTKLRDYNDPNFKGTWIISILQRDMLLLENQLPLFVLLELFGMTVMPNEPEDFTQMIFDFFKDLLQGSRFQQKHYPLKDSCRHLLHFIHENWHKNKHITVDFNETVNHKKERRYIRCATELQEFGIKFKKAYRENLFDIIYRNGIMEIPSIVIENRTESFLRNLIAYEQCCASEVPTYVFDYIIVMDRLINSVKDVELLSRCGIIINTLGDDEVVNKMFNRLCNFVFISGDFRYKRLFEDVNMHCSIPLTIWKATRWNVWMEKFKQDYFSSPWAFISFLAAILLLLLTLAQTLYTILPYY